MILLCKSFLAKCEISVQNIVDIFLTLFNSLIKSRNETQVPSDLSKLTLTDELQIGESTNLANVATIKLMKFDSKEYISPMILRLAAN
ncbi:hypothetical protein T4D_2129 [Trichinella pseudospiralis]|uniref:Uncharacterized protein n=1 Tax=Trichinella pseudospiralis TaxID=6337 RepID=A0A0V1G2Y4_TRIPS|nr:hypothetical protein T4D_2129 [Trichinella pseudospiralis]